MLRIVDGFRLGLGIVLGSFIGECMLKFAERTFEVEIKKEGKTNETVG